MQDNIKGFWFCVLSYLMWGILPVYWKWLSTFNSLTILAFRIICSLIFTLILLIACTRINEFRAALFSLKNLNSLFLRSIFVMSNWLIYVWAVNDGNILACSLGYFICPLAAVLLGCIFLKEKLTAKQKTALIILFIAVLNLVITYGHFPWISISIALTFAIYGLLKKTANVESLPGLSAETAVLSIPALLYLILDGYNSNWAGYTNLSITTILLLIGTGIVTATPLLFFTFGIRRIKISTGGILQFIAPTCTFIIGIFIYDENFTVSQLATFIMIWFSLIIYICDMFKKNTS